MEQLENSRNPVFEPEINITRLQQKDNNVNLSLSENYNAIVKNALSQDLKNETNLAERASLLSNKQEASSLKEETTFNPPSENISQDDGAENSEVFDEVTTRFMRQLFTPTEPPQ